MHIDVRDESIGRLSLASVDKPTRLRRRIRSSRRSPEVRRGLVVFSNCWTWTVPLAPSEACRVNAERERDQLRTRTMLCTRAGIGQVFRDLEMKRGAAPEGAGGPDASAVSLDDALADGEAEARAGTG